jgi:hypothetical protein
MNWSVGGDGRVAGAGEFSGDCAPAADAAAAAAATASAKHNRQGNGGNEKRRRLGMTGLLVSASAVYVAAAGDARVNPDDRRQ